MQSSNQQLIQSSGLTTQLIAYSTNISTLTTSYVRLRLIFIPEYTQQVIQSLQQYASIPNVKQVFQVHLRNSVKHSQLIATFDHHTVHLTDEDIYKDHLQVVFSLRDRVQALVTNCIFSLITALCFIPILNDYLLFIWIAKPTFFLVNQSLPTHRLHLFLSLSLVLQQACIQMQHQPLLSHIYSDCLPNSYMTHRENQSD